uniref:Uncharacterized protein n=1 Tax=Arundo donax TaxID=35708 RepID=A0A0A9H2Z8_ARUDO
METPQVYDALKPSELTTAPNPSTLIKLKNKPTTKSEHQDCTRP